MKRIGCPLNALESIAAYQGSDWARAQFDVKNADVVLCATKNVASRAYSYWARGQFDSKNAGGAQ
jgi:hypothetical protein